MLESKSLHCEPEEGWKYTFKSEVLHEVCTRGVLGMVWYGMAWLVWHIPLFEPQTRLPYGMHQYILKVDV